MTEPIIIPPLEKRTDNQERPAAKGKSFTIYEWRGSGPAYLHVHHDDDEAWHIVEGSIKFRFKEREFTASAGTTVIVPAGVAHAYEVIEPARYLIILPPRLDNLIAELHTTPDLEKHKEIMRKYNSEIVE